MNRTEFEFILAARQRKIKETLGKKAAEYSFKLDILHNFKESAKFQSETSKTTTARELWGMAKKHIISVQDMVFSEGKPSIELVDEKIGDAINYLILLEAIFKEEKE